MRWDVNKYKKVLNEIKNNGYLNDIPIKSKEELYDIIADSIFVDRETAKGWTRPTSTGPKDDEVLINLENLLGVEHNGFSTKSSEEDISDMTFNSLTDFNKQAIYKIYALMKDYLNDTYDNEETFSTMYSEIQKLQLIVPEDLYVKVSNFIDSNLAPIVYDQETVFSNCFTPEIGFYNKNGRWQIRNDKAFKKMRQNIIVKMVEIEETLDKFAMKELRPYLI